MTIMPPQAPQPNIPDGPDAYAVVAACLLINAATLMMGVALMHACRVVSRWNSKGGHLEDTSGLRRWGMEEEALGGPADEWGAALRLTFSLLFTLAAVFVGTFAFVNYYVLREISTELSAVAWAVSCVLIFGAPFFRWYYSFERLCYESKSLNDLFPGLISDVYIPRVVAVYRGVSKHPALRGEFEFAVKSRRLTASEAVREFEDRIRAGRSWGWMPKIMQPFVVGILAPTVSSALGALVVYFLGPSAFDMAIPGGRLPAMP